jgi:hypothetical protein
MDTHAQKAQKAMASFDKKFAPGDDGGQWFPGGNGNATTWFPERMQ